MWHKLTLPQNFLWKFHTCVWCVFIQCRHPCFLHNFPYLLKNSLFQIKAHKVQWVLPACAWVEGHLPKHGEFLRGSISEENNISLHRSPVFFFPWRLQQHLPYYMSEEHVHILLFKTLGYSSITYCQKQYKQF